MSRMRVMKTKAFTAAMGLLTLATSVGAATVTWGPVTTITANTDILTPQNVVEARNYGPAAADISVAVGSETVVFTPATISGAGTSTDSALFDASGTTVTPNFEAVLDTSLWANYGGPWKISFYGLKDGGSYTLQVFSTDDRDRTWAFATGINGTSVHFDLTGKASLFATATIELGPGETSFDVDITFPGSLWMISAAVLADNTPAPPPRGTTVMIR